ncbi:MAG TPA: hypothetical protein VHH09_07745 [Acidimicrobiales bacterium]|nr:hypothetical protein [Acidimicrobiales bacterium]
MGEVLGRGGARVEEVLHRLARAAPAPTALDVAALARATPAGRVDLPVVVVEPAEAVTATAAVDRSWMDVVDARRSTPRQALVAQGRGSELEAALNLAVLLATRDVEGGEAARMASGARLWLLGGAVAWALLDPPEDPFAAWAELVSYGLWPVGPSQGRLVICSELAVDLPRRRCVSTASTEG